VTSRSPRALIAVLAVVLATVVVAGCGGGDEAVSQAPQTVTEQVTVTAQPDPSAAQQPADEPTDVSGETVRLPDDEVESAIQIYQAFFGFTEEQARCLVGEAQRLEALDPQDPAAFLAAGGLEMFSKCGVDFTDFAERFGGMAE
jgi:hypothetical protein